MLPVNGIVALWSAMNNKKFVRWLHKGALFCNSVTIIVLDMVNKLLINRRAVCLVYPGDKINESAWGALNLRKHNSPLSKTVETRTGVGTCSGMGRINWGCTKLKTNACPHRVIFAD